MVAGILVTGVVFGALASSTRKARSLKSTIAAIALVFAFLFITNKSISI